jgi:ferredoxin--NADP+ reductase
MNKNPRNGQTTVAYACGNPAMVGDVQKMLATRGMRRHRRKEPGHVTLETYW